MYDAGVLRVVAQVQSAQFDRNTVIDLGSNISTDLGSYGFDSVLFPGGAGDVASVR
jgi:hypothetical protein